MIEERFFTSRELLGYDGDDLPPYIAYRGVVYDVSDCPRWKFGLHEHLHFPGQDLSSELTNAPHGDDVFTRPCIKRVGRLIVD
jgi:predicted heme/steroid binding protein